LYKYDISSIFTVNRIKVFLIFILVYLNKEGILQELEEGFIKTSELPIKTLTAEQKAKLNLRGNELYNKKDIVAAERIFITTGYSDGLARIGDYYANQNEQLKALKFYHLAHNTHKEDILLDKLAEIIRMLI